MKTTTSTTANIASFAILSVIGEKAATATPAELKALVNALMK